MNCINRSNNPFSTNTSLEHLYSFKDFPIFMGCVNNPISEDLKKDMNWYIDSSSGFIQLNPLLPLEILYKQEHGSGTIGKLWEEHHKKFSEFISKFEIGKVLEIGGLHGILAKNYLNIDPYVDWTIIEPNPLVPNEMPVKVIKDFFENFDTNEKFDTVIHSHVLEHIYDLKTFMNHKSSFMEDGNTLLFSIPNMQVMLEKKYTNCINFEHTFWLTEPYIEYLLSKYGFRLIKKEYFKKDHSIFYSAIKDSTVVPSSLPKNLYKENKQVFLNYVNYFKVEVDKLNSIIKGFDGPIYLFGAHIFSQYLINCGLDISNIKNILDNDSQKENKRLYGTPLISKSPKILKDTDKALVILRAGVYNNEIKKDILTNINPNIKFI